MSDVSHGASSCADSTDLDAVDVALFDALSGEPPDEVRLAAARAAAELVERLSARGLAGPAEQARALALALSDDAPLHPRTMDLSRAAAALRDIDGTEFEDSGPGRRAAAARAEIVALVSDDALRARLTAAATSAGVVVDLHADVDGVRGALASPVVPRALLLIPDTATRLPALSVGYDALASGIAVAVAGGRAGDPPDAILRLPDDLDAGELLDAVRAFAARGRADGARLRVCTTDPVLGSDVRGALEPIGASVTIDRDVPLSAALAVSPPDALVVDARGPLRHEALGLVRGVRVQPDLTETAVVLVAGPGDDVAEAYAAGVDDILVGSPRPEVLAACIGNRLARTGVLRRVGDADPLTGLPRQRETLRLVERLRERSARDGAPLGLALVAIDDLLRTNAEHGRSAGDAVVEAVGRLLSAAVREGDVVGRWTGAEFLLAGHGLAARTAAARLERVIADAAELQPAGTPSGTRCLLSAGIAIHPPDGTSTAALVEAAEGALSRARLRTGGEAGRVVLAETEPRAAATLDVLVVEDDVVTRELVVETLRGQGLRVETVGDGTTAADRLTDADIVPPRVVLLDWELPGLDGPSVLRRMDEAGTLRDTRVIMLTGRSTERDVLAVMRAGATDHVPKPFSVPVLVERVRRALLA